MFVCGVLFVDMLLCYLIDWIECMLNIEVCYWLSVVVLYGDGWFDVIEFCLVDGMCEWLLVMCLFVCIGGVLNIDWVKDIDIICNLDGYLVIGGDLYDCLVFECVWLFECWLYYLEISVLGLFVVGDV